MKKKIWRLSIKSEFCAAHALRNYNGKCERLHGHNYAVEITVQGDKLSEDTELLLDFTVLKKMVKDALSNLDHRFLNEIEPFDKMNPSAENIARYIWQELETLLPEQVKLHMVTVAEKDIQAASYMEIEE